MARGPSNIEERMRLIGYLESESVGGPVKFTIAAVALTLRVPRARMREAVRRLAVEGRVGHYEHGTYEFPPRKKKGRA